jgi:hypothetical protein
MAMVVVEEAARGKSRVRFVELPQALHGEDPRWAAPVLSWERVRLDRHRNPYFEAAEVGLFLARRAGRPAGRIAAHVGADGAGHFGFWTTVDDAAVATGLVEAARDWLTEQGCRSMTGPWSFDEATEPGLLVEGFEAGGTTGRPWRPPWEAALLEDLGFEGIGDTRTWRLVTTEVGPELPTSTERPAQAGPYGDPRLVLEGIAAVPDVSEALRSTGLRSAWGLARRAREGRWDGATVVRCEGRPELVVPALLTAAGRAGYRWVVAPWSPHPDAPPETVHRTYRSAW